MEKKIDNPRSIQKREMSEKEISKTSGTCDDKKEEEKPERFKFSPSADPRFQQQNQTQRCFVMYTDFYRCQHILGEDSEACTWFKDVFTSICPNAWIEYWDELRLSGRLAWHKYKTQGPFPGSKYGD